MSPAIVTARVALRKLCKGKVDQKVEIYRRPLKRLLEIAEAAEEYRAAQNAHIPYVIGGDYGEGHDAVYARVRGAQANLDDLLRCLDVPA